MYNKVLMMYTICPKRQNEERENKKQPSSPYLKHNQSMKSIVDND